MGEFWFRNMKIKEYLIDNYLLNPENQINLFFFIGPDSGLTDRRVKTLCKTLKIDNNNLSCRKWSKNFFEDWLVNLEISFLKYQNRAKTLPSWIIADRDDPGSSIPKKRDITFKWAVLLTGINSVNPWINPYKTNFKYSKNSVYYLIY